METCPPAPEGNQEGDSKNEWLNDILGWVEEKTFKKEEFRAILEMSSEWDLIEDETKEEILTSLNDDAVKKIIHISGAVNGFDLAANIAAGIAGVAETKDGAFQELLDGNFDVLNSPAVQIYLGKLIVAPIFAYAFWKKDRVKRKHLKAATLAIPGVGGIAFPTAALQGDFKKFWSVYRKTKKDYRTAMEAKETDPEQPAEEHFKELLEKAIKKAFRKKDYSGRIINILEAQGLDTAQTELPEPVVMEEEKAIY